MKFHIKFSLKISSCGCFLFMSTKRYYTSLVFRRKIVYDARGNSFPLLVIRVCGFRASRCNSWVSQCKSWVFREFSNAKNQVSRVSWCNSWVSRVLQSVFCTIDKDFSIWITPRFNYKLKKNIIEVMDAWKTIIFPEQIKILLLETLLA